MSFNQKIVSTALLILFGVPAVIFFLNRPEPKKNSPIIPREEVTITIIPGWNLRDVAEYLVKKGFASSTNDVYKITGEPASTLPSNVETTNFEGLIAPETYRVFKDAVLPEILQKLTDQRDKELNSLSLNPGSARQKFLIMASLIEKEARTNEDRKIISDIMWRRLEIGWALQLDSTVHYAIDKTGDLFTTKTDRSVDSPWNTYKYPGLPPTPICNPSLDSIDAALNPAKNNYWYFLTGTDGKMYYAKTLDEHNLNRARYIR